MKIRASIKKINSRTTTFRENNDTQNVSELWESILQTAQRRVDDNKKSIEYPLETRETQLNSLQHLVNALQRSHSLMK
jgi:hypothetical protein